MCQIGVQLVKFVLNPEKKTSDAFYNYAVGIIRAERLPRYLYHIKCFSIYTVFSWSSFFRFISHKSIIRGRIGCHSMLFWWPARVISTNAIAFWEAERDWNISTSSYLSLIMWHIREKIAAHATYVDNMFCSRISIINLKIKLIMLTNGKNSKNKENRKICTFQPYFLLVPIWLKKLKNAGN